MAVKQYSTLELNLFLRKFAVPDGEYTFSHMISGLINDTFLVSQSSTPLFVFQRINHTVFADVSGLMRNMNRALNQLVGPSYTQLNLIKTKEGSSLYSSQKAPISHWRLMGFLEDSQTFDTTPDESVAFEAGRIIGRFHTLLEKSNPSDYSNTIPRFHDLAFRETQFNNAVKHAESQKLASAQTAISFAKATLTLLRETQIEGLPIRVCHNDTKLNNILFSKKTKKALCLIDLDTLMAGHFLYDFGDAARTIANTASEDEADHKKITFEKPLFKAFVKGIASNKKFLSKTEIESLHLGVVLMPFLHGLRALTDFLEHNKYYKVSYENQNLDRALSLFDFTNKAIGELENIKLIIVTVLKI